MAAAAFFGHRDMDYSHYREEIEGVVRHLIGERGVNLFYNGFRGNFDIICAKIVHDLKKQYSNITQLMVLSYHAVGKLELPKYFDESVYLLQNDCTPKYAISRTNCEIVNRCDCIISGVRLDFGGAWSACEYARRKGKEVYSLFDYMSRSG